MREAEFDERINDIKKGLENLFQSPIVRINSGLRTDVTLIAQNIVQIENGIKHYARPRDWDLIQEGITSKR